MSDLVTYSGRERAEKAVWQAKRAWNQMLSGCGGSGAKFRHRLLVWMDEAQASRSFEWQLAARAIRERVRELTAAKKSAVAYWE